MNDATACPCNSGLSYASCCEPLIKGVTTAAGPEALMRARYSAFAHQEMPYLLETLHPGQRSDYDEEGAAKWARESDWTGLEIINVTGDPATENTGSVEFKPSSTRNRGTLVEPPLAIDWTDSVLVRSPAGREAGTAAGIFDNHWVILQPLPEYCDEYHNLDARLQSHTLAGKRF